MSQQTTLPIGPEQVLTMDGDLVASVAATLRFRIKEMIASGVRKLVIDMANSAMADSSGIGLLVATHNSLAKVGGTLSLINVSQQLRELFQTMRLQQHFSISE